MGTFYLKRGDTRPVLSVALKNPDGSAFDLTGVSSVTLHVKLHDGTTFERAMVVDADPTTGIATYTWVPTDWDTGGLVVGVSIEHRMEYEVLTGTVRQTFPNSGYDVLQIAVDIADA